jgi:hypothetical protein
MHNAALVFTACKRNYISGGNILSLGIYEMRESEVSV